MKLGTNDFSIIDAGSKQQPININKGNITSKNDFFYINVSFQSIKKLDTYRFIYASDSHIVLEGTYVSSRGKKTYYNVFLSKQ